MWMKNGLKSMPTDEGWQDRWDLHVHSHWSDGSDSPEQLAAWARRQGLEGIALTDHDTLAGVPEMERAGRAQGLQVLAGIEISCQEPESGRQLHLLGYGIPEKGWEQVEAFCYPTCRGRNEAVRRAALALRQAGYPVDWEQVQACAGPGGQRGTQDILLQRVEQGVCDTMYGPLYKRLFKVGPDGKRGIAYLDFPLADPVEALHCILEAGGVPVLAHPGQYGNYDFVPTLVREGLQGIEVRHPKHGPADVERCRQLARQYGLLTTGGSDYHGRYGD